MLEYKINRSAYKLFRIFLRLVLGRTLRDKWLTKFWVGAFDLPKLIPYAIRHSYRMKCLPGLVSAWYDEPNVSNYLIGLKGGLFVDVGASFGHYLQKLSGNFNRLIAIEADPQIFQYLKEIAPPNCKAINAAIADKNGVAEFHSPLGQYNFGIGSLLSAEQRSNWIEPLSYVTFRVNTITLDSLLSDEDHIDLVKVDVEGAEGLVIAGSSNTMWKIARWLIEIHDPAERERIIQTMRNFGYGAKKLDEKHHLFERDASTSTNECSHSAMVPGLRTSASSSVIRFASMEVRDISALKD
jgi:FkbM family methyltransferase